MSRDDMDFGLNCDFDLPTPMRNEHLAHSVWSLWFGSAQNATRAADILHNVRTPEVALLLKRFRRSQPTALLTMANCSIRIGAMFYPHLSDEDGRLANPKVRLEWNLRQILGVEEERIRDTLANRTAVEIAAEIVRRWPFMQVMFDNGAYHSNYADTLLFLAAISDKVKANGMSALERARVLLAGNVLFHYCTPRLAALIAIHAPDLKECVSYQFKFAGVTLSSRAADKSIWEQVGIAETHATIAYLMQVVAEDARADSASRTLVAVEGVEPRVVVQAGIPRTIAALYQQFCTQEAAPRYQQLLDAFDRYSVALEIKVDGETLPRNLVGRPVEFLAVADQTKALQMLKALIKQESAAFDIEALLVDAETRKANLSKVHAKITELSKVPSVSGMLQLATLAEEARKEILSHREWFQVAMKDSEAYSAVWVAFYEGMKALLPALPAPGPKQTPPAKAKNQDVPRLVAAPAPAVIPESEQMAALRNALATAQANENHLRHELEGARFEAHGLRQKAEALRVFTTKEDHMQCNPALIRRVVAREALGADEVLAYIDFIAGDRVVILPSAWESVAEYPPVFGSADRMLDLLDRLVHPYLDAINSGKPDSEARDLLGGKSYSAQESQSTLSSARLRALREFQYLGETHVFKKHLRVCNQPGKTSMRIFFEIFEGRVVIAYAGQHLEVSSST